MIGHDHPLGKAVLYAIVLFAITHLALSFFYGITHGDAEIANMFHVLSFDLIWPSLGKGALNALFGVVMIVGIWAIIAGILWSIHKKQAAEPKEKGKSGRE